MIYKTLQDVESVIALGKPQEVIELFVADYLQGVEYTKWVEGKDLEALFETTSVDADGNESTISTLVNTYEPVEVDVQAFLVSFKPYARQKRDNLSVTISTGKTFDATLQARQNITDAIALSEQLGVKSTMWKLADNSVVEVTVDELKEARVLALTEFARLSGVQ